MLGAFRQEIGREVPVAMRLKRTADRIEAGFQPVRWWLADGDERILAIGRWIRRRCLA